MQKTQRVQAIDWMKALAIFFVIFYHTYALNTDFLTKTEAMRYVHYFAEVPFSLAVPLFFTVNGFLLLGKTFDIERHRVKIKNLFFLTIFWDVVCNALKLVIYREKTSIIGFLFMVHDSEILWFLRTLFAVYVFVPLIKEVFDHNRKAFLFTFGLISLFVFANEMLVMLVNVGDCILGVDLFSSNYYFLDSFNPLRGFNGFSFAYFMLGGCLAKCEKCKDAKSWGLIMAFLGAWLILFLYGIMISGHMDRIHDVVFDNYQNPLTAIMVLCIFCAFRKWLDRPQPKYLAQISRNTLGIYCVQWPVFAFVKQQYAHVYGANYATNLLTAILVLLICNGIVEFIRKIHVMKRTVEM